MKTAESIPSSHRRPRRRLFRAWLALLFLGSVMWFVCKTSVITYRSSSITLMMWEPGLFAYWGGDAIDRSIHAATEALWPERDGDWGAILGGGIAEQGWHTSLHLIESGPSLLLVPNYWAMGRLGFGLPRFRTDLTNGCLVLPLGWFPAALIVTLAILVMRRARRPLPEHCNKCVFKLTGNISGVCPECGLVQMKPTEGSRLSP